MSASSQSYPRPAIQFSSLTITEVEIEPSPVLGKSRIYLFAAAGAALGVLLGVAAATSSSLPGWLAQLRGAAKAGNPAPAAGTLSAGTLAAVAPGTVALTAVAPRGPRDFGSVNAIVAGLRGHLTADWNGKATYRLAIEPSDPAQQAGFAMAVAGSQRPLSVGFQLMDSTGAVLCGQDAVVRFDAARAAANSAAGKDGAVSRSGSSALEQLEAQETARESGRDIFENEIGDDGQIAAIDAQGSMPCSQQAYASAASWSFSADFPSVAEQAEMLKQQTQTTAEQKGAPARKPASGKKADAHRLTVGI